MLTFPFVRPPDNVWLAQEYAGQLLMKIKPRCPDELDYVLRRLLPKWDRSVEQLPWYLAEVFGRELGHAVGAVRLWQGSLVDRVHRCVAVHGRARRIDDPFDTRPAGSLEEPRAVLRSLEDQGRDWMPELYLALGDEDKAMAQIETAFAARRDVLLSIRCSVEYDRLLEIPRFREIVRAIGFPS